MEIQESRKSKVKHTSTLFFICIYHSIIIKPISICSQPCQKHSQILLPTHQKNTKKDTRNQWFFRWSMRFISVEVSDPHSHESNIHETTWLMLAINGSVCLAMYAMWLSQAVFLVKGIQKSRKRSISKKSFCSTGLSSSINWAKKTQFGRCSFCNSPSERPTENETPVFRRKTQLQRKKCVPVVLSTNHSLKHVREGSDSGSGSECWQTWNVLIPWLCVSPVRQFVTAYVDFKKTRVPGGQKKKHTVHSFSCHVDTSASRFKAMSESSID